MEATYGMASPEENWQEDDEEEQNAQERGQEGSSPYFMDLQDLDSQMLDENQLLPSLGGGSQTTLIGDDVRASPAWYLASRKRQREEELDEQPGHVIGPKRLRGSSLKAKADDFLFFSYPSFHDELGDLDPTVNMSSGGTPERRNQADFFRHAQYAEDLLERATQLHNEYTTPMQPQTSIMSASASLKELKCMATREGGWIRNNGGERAFLQQDAIVADIKPRPSGIRAALTEWGRNMSDVTIVDR